MSVTMNPTDVYKALRDSYLRYLETSFHLKNPSLLEQFRELLCDKTQPPLVRQPILEMSPGFKSGASIEHLVNEKILPEAFRKFEPDILERPLYAHQEIALRRAITEKRNLVVATGTGSGKTETFLYPIISHLLREAEAGTLKHPGVRALLLYPMNALANDQIARLRTIAELFPDITFGRYTGETDQDEKKALESYRAYHDGKDPLVNELICRDQMQAAPPHILFTNYAMLEYLLIRPKDSCLFYEGHWRFLVLDEVHTYSGALGAEIAMLLRRLKDRVVQSEPGRLQCIATSATLGGGENGSSKVANFASGLFGEIFESDDIVRVEHVELKPADAAWGTGSAELYRELKNAAFDGGKTTVDDLVVIANRNGALGAVVDIALAATESCQDNEKTPTFLHHFMEGDSDVRRLRALLNEKRALELHEVQGISAEKVIDLVALGAHARKSGNAAPLIPARYHIMARAISGIYAWFNAEGRPQLLARRKKHHRVAGQEYAVFELASCNRCGEVMLVGNEDGGYLSQPPDVGDDPITKLGWFQLRPEADSGETDEDDAVEEEQDAKQSHSASPMRLCRICGRIHDASTFDLDGCEGHAAETIVIFKLQNKPRRNVPRQCPSCLNNHGSVASRIVTGKQVPVAVLATALYQQIPESPDLKESAHPGGGRKLMMFSDSRQDAAFFAPFMDKTYNKFKQRRYLVEALYSSAGAVDLQEWVQHTRSVAEKAGEWDEDSSAATKKKDAGRWVLREWTATDRRLALEGSGCVVFRLRKPERFTAIDVLSGAPWNQDQEAQWTLIQVLLDTLRYQGIVSFDDEVFNGIGHDDAIFAPRNVPCYLRGSKSDPRKRIYAWEPAHNLTNKRLGYLLRILRRKGVAEDQAKELALTALQQIWAAINHPNSPLNKLFERGTYNNETNLLRLKPNWWQVQIAGDDAHRCDTCGTVTAFAIDGICPMSGCMGTVKPYLLEERQRNHYYNLFNNMEPIPLKVSEHTAQLSKEKAFEAQQDFIGGKVNMLSCTTTFEMGVDVGDLQAVFMRNMPPNPGNYVQRAGRAGRRAGNAAIIVSFAQRRTHDFAYFEQWQRMVQGAVRPPTIHLDNIKIIRRHVHAEAMADFFRANPDVFIDKLECLFDPAVPRPVELGGYLAKRPEQLKARLKRVIPSELHTRLGIDNWQWLDGQGMNEEEERECFVNRLATASSDVRGDWVALQQAQKNALEQEKGRLADMFLQQLNTLKRRSLLGKLGTYGLMPKYGFPTEVVELKIRGSGKECGEIELDRDMKLALSEFAPGNEVIAGGKVWKSEAIVLPGGERKLHEFHYWHCDDCRFFSAEMKIGQLAPSKACHCGNMIEAKTYVYPEFGFSTSAKTGSGNVGDERPAMKSYSEVFFHDDAAEPEFIPIVSVPQVAYREAKQGWIYVVNNNQGNDFYICGSCGYATKDNPVVVPFLHSRPWSSDQKCIGSRPERKGLGYRYRTDVLELRLPVEHLDRLGLQSPDDIHSLWLSVLYALVNGACQALDIDERDIGGCLYYSRKDHPSLVLFDTAPGGAGFVHEVRAHFEDVLDKAIKLLDCKSCGEDSSCIACLRTYFNQRDHNRLRRGWSLDYLERLGGR